jgi:DHA2 family multidrug resistance protein-like MFS transporter
VALGYLLAVAAVVLPSGRWLDSVGHRSALVFAVAGFAATSAMAAVAPSFALLVAARVVQGIFGAALLALVPALVAGAVPPEQRGRAIGVVATIGPLGSVSGPPIGGLLVSALGWRSIFLVNLPVSAVLIALALVTMPADRPLRPPNRAWWTEAGTLGGAVLCAMLALSQATSEGALWLALLAPAAGLAMLWSRLSGSRRILDVLEVPVISRGLAALLLIAAAIAAVQFLAPFFVERKMGENPATTGLIVLALPAAMAAFGMAAGFVVDRIGARPVAVIGALALCAGMIATVPLSSSWQPFDLIWRLALIGAGLGLFNGPNQTAIMVAAPDGQQATASAASGLARSLAFAAGPLLATTAWGLSSYETVGMRFGLAAALVLCAAAVAVISGLGRRGHLGLPAVDPAR